MGYEQIKPYLQSREEPESHRMSDYLEEFMEHVQHPRLYSGEPEIFVEMFNVRDLGKLSVVFGEPGKADMDTLREFIDRVACTYARSNPDQRFVCIGVVPRFPIPANLEYRPYRLVDPTKIGKCMVEQDKDALLGGVFIQFLDMVRPAEGGSDTVKDMVLDLHTLGKNRNTPIIAACGADYVSSELGDACYEMPAVPMMLSKENGKYLIRNTRDTDYLLVHPVLVWDDELQMLQDTGEQA